MAQEESILGCSYSGGSGGGGAPGGGGGGGRGGGGSSRSKKIKQKKVPQRGLGVAQLEKIRIEEQHKRESLQAANILARNAVASPTDSTSFFDKFGPNLSSFHNSAPNLEILQENCVQVSKHFVGEIDSKPISSPKLWGGDYNLARFDPNSNSSFENGPVLPLPVVPQKSKEFHVPSSSSSMLQMNSSSGIQPLSLASSQMEPPSNQSFRSNNYAPLWTEEDKIVGLKRSYPFSLGSPPAPSLSFNPIHALSSSKSDELALCSNGYTDRMDPKSICIRGGSSNSSPSPSQSSRGGPSNSSSLPEKKPNEVTADDGRLNGDFLTLAPPSVASPLSIGKHKQFPGYSGYHQGREYECRPSQEYAKDQMHQPGSSGSVEQPFSFFPVKNQTSTDASNGNDEKGEPIDLNLKL